MAKVVYSAGIDHVSGALSKPSKNGQHSCEKMLLATHRVAATQSNDCNRLYLRSKIQRSTPVTTKEVELRNRFTAVRAAVATRATSLAHMTADQEAFEAQRYAANGKRTMRAYLWSVCGAEYDAEHPQG